jgi:hypothetical protein
LATYKSAWFSRRALWSLFLICAFPLHVWTFILAFRDFSWVVERTNVWDAIGVLAYALVFAFVESILVFLAAVLLGFLLPRRWEEGRRLALLSVLVLITALWGMLGQLYFLWNLSVPEEIIIFYARSDHPYRLLVGTILILVSPTVLIPTYLVVRSEGSTRFILGITDRLSLLASLYLLLDAAGLVIVLLRNI